MKLFVNLKPRTYEAPTKYALNEKIRFSVPGDVAALTFSKYGSGYLTMRQKIFIVYNLEKRRKKNHNHKDVVRRGHWVAHVYHIPLTVLESLGLRVSQNHRNFSIQKVK